MTTEEHVRQPAQYRGLPEHRWNVGGAQREGTEPASAAGVSSDPVRGKPTERPALKHLLRQFAELREYASLYAAVRIDNAKAFARNAMVRMVFSALGFVAVGGILVIASWLVLSGIAQGLGTLFGDRSWIGTLLTGLAALVGVGVGVQRIATAHRRNALRAMVEKHEARQAHQRTRFGWDAHDRMPASVRKSGERSFLADREADAKTAIARGFSDTKDTLAILADVRSCTTRHPWIMTGSAAAAGVVAGAMLSPSVRGSKRSKSETKSRFEAESRSCARTPETACTTNSFLFSIIRIALAAAIPPLIQSWFSPAVAAQEHRQCGAPASSDSAGAVTAEGSVGSNTRVSGGLSGDAEIRVC